MKKILFTYILLLVATMTFAVPAKPGVWTTIHLDSGTEVRVQQCGDEHLRYFMDENGTCYIQTSEDSYSVADLNTLRSSIRVAQKRLTQSRRNAAKLNNASKKRIAGVGKSYIGDKKGLIILVQFPDREFKESYDNTFYNKLANAENFNEGSFKGSVHDYFRDQSNGLFNLTFDVIGPITLSKSYTYYGKNVYYSDGTSDDANAGAMIAEACLAIDDDVDFADYDWDGDGEADQVFVIYAGRGESNGGGANTVWPHMFYLSSSDYGKSLTLDDTVIDTYACACELNGSNTTSGIGTICHEFSHCLGFADLYDTTYGSGYGMKTWDLMATGNYNGNSFCPAGYTGYEKWVAGWIEPTELRNDTTIESQKAQSDGGETFIMYNDNHREEFYFIDNRQQTGWDECIPKSGLLVTHIDYDQEAWETNVVNDDADHQRYTPIHAGKVYADKNGWSYYQSEYDVFPYEDNDSLTNQSYPSASLFNANTDGTMLMNKKLLDIRQNNDGTMAFRFCLDGDAWQAPSPGTVLLSETFDNCSGTGGNDGKWSGTIAAATFKPDVEGWTSRTCRGANHCAKFGSIGYETTVTSPSFQASGKTRLTFMVAPWTGDDNVVKVIYDNTLLGSFTIEEEKWNECSVDFDGIGTSQLQFVSEGRLFLDEVKVFVPEETSDINDMPKTSNRKADNRIYTINGLLLKATDVNALKSGIYIINDHKYIK
jgi:immune inhibitor A